MITKVHQTVCYLIVVYNYIHYLITVILMEPKVTGLCHQYRAGLASTLLSSDQDLYIWNLKFFILKSLIGEKCSRRGNFVSSQMRRNKKQSSAYFNIPLTTVRFTVVRHCFLSGRKGEQLLQHKFEIRRFFLIYVSKISTAEFEELHVKHVGTPGVAPFTFPEAICNQPCLTVSLTGIK
jgi:hypothetical protein